MTPKEHLGWVKEDIEEYGDNGGYDCGFALRMLKAQEKVEKWMVAGGFPDLPVALFTGTEDKICSPEGCYFAEKHIQGRDVEPLITRVRNRLGEFA